MQNIKKLPLWSKILIGTAISILIIILIGYSFVNAKINKIKRSSETEKTPSTEEAHELNSANNNDANESELNDIVWDDDENVIANKEVVNILLIGQDRRPDENIARSDSMIIASINKRENTIKFTSLMRDMYVQIPGHNDNKINAAYALGGMELLDDTIEKNFLIPIDGNIEVDFEQFTKIIDKIDGIDIYINEEEAEYLNANTDWNLSAGICHMTGDIALKYSRIRYVGNDDYERTERQREVLSAVFNEMKDSSLPTILGLAGQIFPLITTDLSNSEIIGYITKIISLGITEVETYRIPADGQFEIARVNEMSVLLPDLSGNRELLKEYIWGNSEN
nr:LCP family protein [Sedimentibacter sp.]